MKAFFEGIQWLFENIFFAPQNFLRHLELETLVCCKYHQLDFYGYLRYATWYWCKQLKSHKATAKKTKIQQPILYLLNVSL